MFQINQITGSLQATRLSGYSHSELVVAIGWRVSKKTEHHWSVEVSSSKSHIARQQ